MGQGKSREIRSKIKSIQNTAKITRAMKLVSASKLKKASRQVELLKPYMEGLKEVVASVGVGNSKQKIPQGKKSLVVVFAGERALCGAYNSNSVKNALLLAEAQKAEGFEVEFVAVGKKAAQGLKTRGKSVLKEFNLKEVLPSSGFSAQITEYLTEMHLQQGFARIFLAYTEFKSAMSKYVRQVQILPYSPGQYVKTQVAEAIQGRMLFEPSSEKVQAELQSQLIKAVFHQSYVESLASEYGSRMVAMDNAAKNCKELVYKLTLKLNRERQAAITQEIAEIVGGSAGVGS